jgi:hypothetical protein
MHNTLTKIFHLNFMFESLHINVKKNFHKNYHVKIMHINWSYDQTIIIL